MAFTVFRSERCECLAFTVGIQIDRERERSVADPVGWGLLEGGGGGYSPRPQPISYMSFLCKCCGVFALSSSLMDLAP